MGANYGTGSGQQIVTSINKKDDSNSLWIVHDAMRHEKPCRTGQTIKCGDNVRFEHNPTGKNLHSHAKHKAPLSKRQEVSAFGDDGYGDMGDDWEVQCNERADYGPIKKAGESLTGKDLFHLSHKETGCLLVTDSGSRFTQQNCPRCVIVGHMEVACDTKVK